MPRPMIIVGTSDQRARSKSPGTTNNSVPMNIAMLLTTVATR